MFPFPTTKDALKAAWPALLVGALVIALIIIGAVLSTRGCGKTEQGDYLEDARQQILEQVSAERAANLERIKALEADLYDLRDQVDSLDAELKASAEEREEVHDAIDNAGSIDDVDRILRSGIPGVSGRRDR